MIVGLCRTFHGKMDDSPVEGMGTGSPYQQDSDSTELRIYGHH